MAGEATTSFSFSFFGSGFSSEGATVAAAVTGACVMASFLLLPLCRGSSTGGGISVSVLSGSNLGVGAGMGVSFCTFVSMFILGPSPNWLRFGVSGAFPFGLVDATEAALCLTTSGFSCVEF